MKTLIWGASDDLVEISGAIEEEANLYNGDITISCSDGTKGSITYNGIWDITINKEGTHFEKLIKGTEEEIPHTDEDAKGCSAYSDVLVLSEGIEWVRIGRKTYKK